MKKIGIIGFGNMGSALAERIKSKYQVFVFDIDKSKTIGLKNICVARSINELVNKSDAVILAVKPQDFENLLNDLRGELSGQLIISIVTGKTCGYIERVIGKIRVIRVVPNLPARIGKGTICLSKGKYATGADLDFAKVLFSYLGDTMEVREEKLNAATAVCGSGPGFFYRLIQLEHINPNNMTEVSEFAKKEFIPHFTPSATSIGFSNNEARILVTSTTAGSVALLEVSGLSPSRLEKQVKSKKGTTEAGLKKLRGIRSLKKAVLAAFKRAKQLAKEK